MDLSLEGGVYSVNSNVEIVITFILVCTYWFRHVKFFFTRVYFKLCNTLKCWIKLIFLSYYSASEKNTELLLNLSYSVWQKSKFTRDVKLGPDAFQFIFILACLCNHGKKKA